MKLGGVAAVPARDVVGCHGACGIRQWLEVPASQTPSRAWREQWCGCCLLAMLFKRGIRCTGDSHPKPLVFPLPGDAALAGATRPGSCRCRGDSSFLLRPCGFA